VATSGFDVWEGSIIYLCFLRIRNRSLKENSIERRTCVIVSFHVVVGDFHHVDFGVDCICFRIKGLLSSSNFLCFLILFFFFWPYFCTKPLKGSLDLFWVSRKIFATVAAATSVLRIQMLQQASYL